MFFGMIKVGNYQAGLTDTSATPKKLLISSHRDGALAGLGGNNSTHLHRAWLRLQPVITAHAHRHLV